MNNTRGIEEQAERPALEKYTSDLFDKDYEFAGMLAASRNLSNEIQKTPISLSENEARILSTLVASHNCKNFVEIGTLTGYSALWILHALVDGGELFTFEKNDAHAKAALEVFVKVHLLSEAGKPGFKGKRIHLYEGDAEETLKVIEDKGPFDGIFIDGNKSAYPLYLDWAEANLKKGGIIIADNVFLGGSVWGATTESSQRFGPSQVAAMQSFNQRLADRRKYTSAIFPTGEGLFFAVKNF